MPERKPWSLISFPAPYIQSVDEPVKFFSSSEAILQSSLQ